MPLTNKQKIIFFGFGLIVFILILGLLGIIPGIKKKEDSKKNLVFTLNVWTINEDVKGLNDFVKIFKNTYPKSKVIFKNFEINSLEDYKKYEEILINALAEGKGPDIFMIKNNLLLKHINKLYPLPKKTFNYDNLNFQNNFPNIVVQDFSYQNNIYGFPLSGDMLVLIYNQEIFDQNNIFVLPETWQDFLDILKKLPVDEKGKIKGAAFGLDLESYSSYGDLLLLLLLQKNAIFSSKNRIDFNNDIFKEVINFYLQFSNNLSDYYSWDVEDDSKVLDLFKKGEFSMLFGYYSDFKKKFEKDKIFSLTFVPQFDLSKKVNFLNYYSFVVSKQSKFKNLSWDFVLKITHDQGFLNNYLKDKKIPMNKKILTMKNNDVFLEKIKFSILTAKDIPFFDVDEFKKNVFNNLRRLKDQEIDLNDFILILKNIKSN